MRKIFLLAYIFFCSTYAQEALNPNLITFPVSPEAARLTTFGNVPVNLFYGQLDKTVELFTGKVGDYTVPVNLNYNYAGFRLEDTPSIIGMGWQLSVGGVIAREVRGIPDEHPRGYYGGQQNIIGTYFNTGAMTFPQALDLIDGKYDTEADLYTVSVNGINFSFKIGLDGNPAFLSRHDYKLQITRNTNSFHDILSFTLTDTSGNKYYFTEREFTQRVQGQDIVFQDNFPKYVTSWQLTKVVTNTNLEILYLYQNDNFYNFSYYASGDTGIMENPQSPPPSAAYNQGAAKDLIERKLLTKIQASNFVVNFTVGNSNNNKVYGQIKINDHNGLTVHTYDFTYTGLRNALTKIKHNNAFFYEFGYFGGTIHPAFLNSIGANPWGQDFWGFANGANNTYAFSRPAINGPALTADRSPNFASTALGALNSIKYPTGGYTQIAYEQNTIATETYNANTPLNIRIKLDFESDSKPGSPLTKEWTYRKTFPANTIATLRHWVESTPQGQLEMSIHKIDSDGYCPNVYYAFNVENGNYHIFDGEYHLLLPRLRTIFNDPYPAICPDLQLSFSGDGCSGANCSFNHNSAGKFLLTAGTYEFKFKTFLNRHLYTKAGVELDYYRADIEGSQYTNSTTGGIRVKSITDYPVSGDPVTKFYDYNDENGNSTAVAHSNLVTEVKYRIGWMSITPSGVLGLLTIDPPSYVREYSARPYNMLLKRGIPVYYKAVKEYTEKEEVFVKGKLACDGCERGDISKGESSYTYIGNNGLGYGTTYTHYPKGYKQITFRQSYKRPSDYPFEPVGTDNSSGLISENKTYGPANTVNHTHQELISEKLRYTDFTGANNSFVTDNTNYPKSLKMGYKIRRDRAWAQNAVTNLTLEDCYHVNVYKEADSDALLWDKQTVEYFDGNTVENYEAREYDSHKQLKKLTTINDLSNTGDKLTTEIYYPYDFNDTVSQDMVSKNMLSPVVKVVKKQNTDIIETTHFQYNKFTGNIFKPKSFLNSKNDDVPETRVNYGYDTKGNLILMHKESIQTSIPQNLKNNRTIIVWGYNNSQPIAKIEGTQLATLPAATLLDLQTKSNNDIDNCTTPQCKEEILRQALNDLRSTYPESLITTYTYDPLLGITSMTDPKGLKLTYEYDSFGRLLRVKDHLGNIVSENEYNYKLKN